MSVKVTVKWNKEKFENVEINLGLPVAVFKAQLFSLTGVPTERQKVMGVKGGVLKDDADLSTLGLKDGMSLMLMGTADQAAFEAAVKAPTAKIQFLEDMPEDMQIGMLVGLPSGLNNLGNTCYMNATLQCLRSVPELRAVLPHSASAATSALAASGDLASAMHQTFGELEAKKGAPVQPWRFWNLLKTAFPQFGEMTPNGPAQQDAEECLSQARAVAHVHSHAATMGPKTDWS